MPGRTCTAMKYRPIGLPLRSRPRRCSSIAASIASSLRPTCHGHDRDARRLAGPLPRRRVVAGRGASTGALGRAVGVGAAAAVRSASTRSPPPEPRRLRRLLPTAGGVVVGHRLDVPGRGAATWGSASCRRSGAGARAPARRPRPTGGLPASVRGVRCRRRSSARRARPGSRSGSSLDVVDVVVVGGLAVDVVAARTRPSPSCGDAVRRGSPDAVRRGRVAWRRRFGGGVVAGRVSRGGRGRDVGRRRVGGGDRVGADRCRRGGGGCRRRRRCVPWAGDSLLRSAASGRSVREIICPLQQTSRDAMWFRRGRPRDSAAIVRW